MVTFLFVMLSNMLPFCRISYWHLSPQQPNYKHWNWKWKIVFQHFHWWLRWKLQKSDTAFLSTVNMFCLLKLCGSL